MKEIQTNGITILLVEVPEKAHDFYIRNHIAFCFKSLSGYNEGHHDFYVLPSGQYQILGKSTELSEEQMKEIVHEPKKLFAGKYYNYKKGANVCSTVQESYLSLLEANGIVGNQLVLIKIKD